MPGQEHVGHSHPAKLGRPRVLRKVQQASRERVARDRLVVADDAGHQTRDRVDDDQRGQLAPRHHVVAYRQRLGRQRQANALVDPFVPAAQDRDVPERAQALGVAMRETAPVGGRQHDRVRLAAPRANLVHRAKQRLRLEYHPRPAAERHVIDHPVPVRRVVAQVVHLQVHETAADRPPHDAFRERRADHPRKDRDDVDFHSKNRETASCEL